MNAQATEIDRIPSHDELVARAKALIPVLKERAAHCEALRRLPDETLTDFHEAGFFKMLQPRRWGGYESHPNTFFDVQIAIASACPSSAWVFGVVALISRDSRARGPPVKWPLRGSERSGNAGKLWNSEKSREGGARALDAW